MRSPTIDGLWESRSWTNASCSEIGRWESEDGGSRETDNRSAYLLDCGSCEPRAIASSRDTITTRMEWFQVSLCTWVSGPDIRQLLSLIPRTDLTVGSTSVFPSVGPPLANRRLLFKTGLLLSPLKVHDIEKVRICIILSKSSHFFYVSRPSDRLFLLQHGGRPFLFDGPRFLVRHPNPLETSNRSRIPTATHV
jgi:hypothetical protein